MGKVIYSPGFFQDLDRITDFLMEVDPQLCTDTTALIFEATEILARHPWIGRPAENGLRELLIAQGRNGYVALYRHRQDLAQAIVLALRHQREVGVDHDEPNAN